MQLPSKEERNFMVSGFRMMRENNPLASHHMRSVMQPKVAAPPPAAAAALPKVSSPVAAGGSKAEQKEGGAVSSPVPPSHRRRVTKRDAAIEETRARKLSDASSPVPAPSVGGVGTAAAAAVFAVSGNVAAQESAAKLLSPMPATMLDHQRDGAMAMKSQLQDERINNDRLRTQALLLQNELHERDEEIVLIKKERAVLEQSMKAKQVMYEQDAHVRMQIGQKLEQTILDREEQKELNEALSLEIFRLRQQLAQYEGGGGGGADGGESAGAPTVVVRSGEGRL